MESSVLDTVVKPMMKMIWPDFYAKQFQISHFLEEQDKI